MSETTKRFIIRQRFLMIQAIRQGVPVVQVARQFGCSRKTVYKWLARYRDGGLKALLDRSRKPRGHPKSLEPSVVRLIVRLRQQTRFGPVRLQWLLWERHGLAISRWGIYRALKRSDLITRGRRRKKKDYRLYTLPKPGDEVQIDVKVLDKLIPGPLPGVLRRLYQYTAIDDCSRWRCLWLAEDFSAQLSVRFLRQVACKAPFRIRAVRTDGGGEFTYTTPTPKIHPFTRACRKLGIKHKINRAGYPQANGKVERSHRTDEEEFYRVTPPAEWSRQIERWEQRYNFERGHQSLHGMTPVEFLWALQAGRESVTYVSR